MPRSKKNKTRSYQTGEASAQSMLAAAAELLQEKGYYGTGLNEILARSGAPRGSLYHHFPGGKDELVIKALEYSASILEGAMAEHSVDTFLDYFREQLLRSDFSKGCPVASVAQEVGGTKAEIRLACSRIYSRWESAIAARLNGKDAPARARRILGELEGALLLAKVHRDITYLDSVTL